VNVSGRVTTGRCNHDFFRGGSKVNYNIGTFDIGHWQKNRISDPIPRPESPTIFVIILSS